MPCGPRRKSCVEVRRSCRPSSLRRARTKLFGEVRELRGRYFRDGNELKSTGRPRFGMESVALGFCGDVGLVVSGGPNQEIDRVLAPVKHERRGGLTFHAFETSTRERKASIRKVRDGRREIEFAGEP